MGVGGVADATCTRARLYGRPMYNQHLIDAWAIRSGRCQIKPRLTCCRLGERFQRGIAFFQKSAHVDYQKKSIRDHTDHTHWRSKLNYISHQCAAVRRSESVNVPQACESALFRFIYKKGRAVKLRNPGCQSLSNSEMDGFKS